MRTAMAYTVAFGCLALLLAGQALSVCDKGFTGIAPNCKACPDGTTTIRAGDSLPCNVCASWLSGKPPNCRPCKDFTAGTITLPDGTNRCVCGKGFTGTYPNCKSCPLGLSTTRSGNGQRCTCVQEKSDFFQLAFPCSKCDTGKGWYRPLLSGFWPAGVKIAPKNTCVSCNSQGAVVKTVKGVKYCGCDTKNKFGFLGKWDGLAFQSSLCTLCIGRNTVIDAQGRCVCKKGYGISRNLFGGDDYCMPCGGKTSTVDGKGFCKCKPGYAFDSTGSSCILCRTGGFTSKADGTCECKKGFFGTTEASPFLKPSCSKCAPGQSSEVRGGNPRSVCFCKDPGAGVRDRGAYENGCTCRWGFQVKKGTTACEYNPFCKKGEYIIQFWSGKALPAGWDKKSFPRAVLTVKPTAVKGVKAGKNLLWAGTASGLPKGVDAKLYVARIRRCMCVPHKDFGSRFNFFFKVAGGAGARVEIDGGANPKARCAGKYYDQNACLRPLIDPIYPVPGTATAKGATVTFPKYKERPGPFLSSMDYILEATNYKACHNLTVLFWNNARGGKLEVRLPGSTLN